MEDPTSDPPPAGSQLLPSHRCICGCRIGGFFVRVLVVEVDVLNSFRRNSDMQIAIYLRTLSSGGLHPAAQFPTFHYSRRCNEAFRRFSVSVTNSRLAIVAEAMFETYLVIWDWKSARILFVRPPQSFSILQTNSTAHLGAGREALP